MDRTCTLLLPTGWTYHWASHLLVYILGFFFFCIVSIALRDISRRPTSFSSHPFVVEADALSHPSVVEPDAAGHCLTMPAGAWLCQPDPAPALGARLHRPHPTLTPRSSMPGYSSRSPGFARPHRQDPDTASRSLTLPVGDRRLAAALGHLFF
jgi:hypothetical protein